MREPQEDEVFLDCDDSYAGLPSKVQGIARWALAQGYDYILKIDDDVVIVPRKLLASNFQRDFTGHRNDIRPFPVPYGFCYWLSKRAMQLVIDAQLPRDNNDEVWVTETLSKQCITLHHDPSYLMHNGSKEDFPSTARPLRAPKRTAPMTDHVEDPFAWCMYLCWGPGYRLIPDSTVIGEMKKVFNRRLSD